MKIKGFIRLLTVIMAVFVLISSLSFSAFAQEDEVLDDEAGGEYDERYEEDYAMNCSPPVWLIPIIIAFVPLSFCFEMFAAFRTGDFSVLEQIPELFVELFSLVFD